MVAHFIYCNLNPDISHSINKYNTIYYLNNNIYKEKLQLNKNNEDGNISGSAVFLY